MVTPDHHDALVERLVQETTPVRRLWSVRARFGVFATFGLIAIAIASLASPRPDLAVRFRDPTFMLGLGLLIVAANVAAFLALRSAVPDRFPSRLESTVLMLLVSAAALATAIPGSPAQGNALAPTPEWACALRTLVVAAVPWSLLLIAIRRGAPVRVTTAAMYAGAAALLLATAILRTGCPQDGPAHWFPWHFAAVAMGALLSASLAPTWLQTWRRH
jgi:hypothetical protein